MPAHPIQVDREQVRMMVADFGYQETSQRTGIAYATLRQWAKRGKWHVTHSKAVTNVTTPIAQAHADALAEYEGETRLSLARSARKMAKQSETATLKQSPLVHKAAQVAGIAFRWGDQDKATNQFTLNVLNINSLSVETVEE